MSDVAADKSITLEGTPNPEAPNPQLPVVQKLRIRYAKTGRLRFTSHRDFGRAFERAVRRASLPIGYSSGFTPHPKISYAGASPTGAASLAEYLEIGLTRPCDPDQVRIALDDSLPSDFVIMEVIEGPITKSGGALAELLESSHWRIQLPGVELADVEAAAERFLALPEVLVERMMKRGRRAIDTRAQVVSMRADLDDCGCAILDVVVRHDIPSVRPDDVLVGLRTECGFAPAQTPIATRLAQGPLDPEDGSVGDPLAPRRDAS